MKKKLEGGSGLGTVLLNLSGYIDAVYLFPSAGDDLIQANYTPEKRSFRGYTVFSMSVIL